MSFAHSRQLASFCESFLSKLCPLCTRTLNCIVYVSSWANLFLSFDTFRANLGSLALSSSAQWWRSVCYFELELQPVGLIWRQNTQVIVKTKAGWGRALLQSRHSTPSDTSDIHTTSHVETSHIPIQNTLARKNDIWFSIVELNDQKEHWNLIPNQYRYDWTLMVYCHSEQYSRII